MKTIPSMAKASLLIAFVAAGTATAAAQNSNDRTAVIKQLVETQQYVFNAQTAFSMGGHTQQLTGESYDLTVTKNAVKAYLPYFGRAYSVPIDPTQGGINFNSSSFNYTLGPRKKGGWDVFIKFTDAGDVQQLSMTISQTGYASLQVTSNNRQAISYNGYIDAIKEKK